MTLSLMLQMVVSQKGIIFCLISQKNANIIKKCLATNPDTRYKNCIELTNDLSDIENAIDWQYIKEIDAEKWITERDKNIISLEKTVKGYMAVNTNKLSGKSFKIRNFCKSELSESEKIDFFRET